MIRGKFFIVNGQPKVFPPAPPSPPLSILPSMTVGAWGDPHMYISVSSLDNRKRTVTKKIATWDDNKQGPSGNNELKLLDLQTTTHSVKIFYTNRIWTRPRLNGAKVIDNIRVEYNGTSTTYNNTTKLTLGPVTINIAKFGSGDGAYLNFEMGWSNIDNVVELGGAIVPILKRVVANNGNPWNGGAGAFVDGFSRAGAPYGLSRSSFETVVGIQSQSSSGDLYFSDVELLLHADGNFTDSSTSPKTVSSRPSYPTVLVNGSPKFGSASFAISGNGDAVQTTSLAFNRSSTAAFTCELFFRPTDTNQGSLMLVESFYGSAWDSRQFSLFKTSSGSIFWSLFQGGSNQFQSGNLGGNVTVGQWHHLVACREEGGPVRVYLNGSLLGSVEVAVLGTNSGSGNADLLIGSGFYGEIDEVRWTNVNRYTGSSLTVPTEPYPNNGIITTITEDLVLSEKEANFLAITTDNFVQDGNIFDNFNNEETGDDVLEWDETAPEMLEVLSNPVGLEGVVDQVVGSGTTTTTTTTTTTAAPTTTTTAAPTTTTTTVAPTTIDEVVITSVPASFSNVMGYPSEYSLVGQHFCRTNNWFNRGVEGLPDFQLGEACTCSDNPNDCVYSGDHSFAFTSWPHWETGEPDAWTGWLFYIGGMSPVVFNNSQDSTNVPTTGWKDSSDGIGNPNASASSFSLTASGSPTTTTVAPTTTTTTTDAPTTTTTTTTSEPSVNGLLISGSMGEDGTFCPVATYNGKPFYKHTSLMWFIWHDGLDWLYGDKPVGNYDSANPTNIVNDLRWLASNYSNSSTAPLTGWGGDLFDATITQTSCGGGDPT